MRGKLELFCSHRPPSFSVERKRLAERARHLVEVLALSGTQRVSHWTLVCSSDAQKGYREIRIPRP